MPAHTRKIRSPREIVGDRVRRAYKANKIPMTPDIESMLQTAPLGTLEALASAWEHRANTDDADEPYAGSPLFNPKTPVCRMIDHLRRMAGFASTNNHEAIRLVHHNQWHGPSDRLWS